MSHNVSSSQALLDANADESVPSSRDGSAAGTTIRDDRNLVRAASEVNDLSRFLALLGQGGDPAAHGPTIRTLPDRRRALALAALGVRILALPADEQEAAIDVFLELALGCSKPWPPELDELRKAASRGVRGLLMREGAAVSRSGVAAIRRGEGVRAVAQRLGISSATWITFLEGLAACGPGLRAVAQGEDLQAVIDRLQISDEAHVAMLRCTAANTAVSRGENVLAAARRLGIVDAATISSLERVATFRPGFAAVERGASALDVARRLGISDPVNVALLVRKVRERRART